MNHGSLFSGTGGFDLPADWMGWNNLFHCEWNPFGQKVLKYYWPKAKSYEDITKTDFSIWRGKIDILTGGFPCQPYSSAGKRLGKEDERHLWPEMLRAIREIQPRWVVGENVLGLTNWNGGLVFEEVCADLESQGYEVQPYILPAASVNAPHRRDRVWFVAYANGAITPDYKGTNGGKAKKVRRQETNNVPGECRSYGNATDPESESSRGKLQQRQRQGEFRGLDCENATDPSGEGLQRGEKQRGVKGIGPKRDKQPSRFLQPTWEEFPTQPPICSGNDGLPTQLDGITFPKWRNESIKGYGNAVVPQVVYQIFKAIEAYEAR